MSDYFVYLDEFGHIGPYVARSDPKYKESPVFGLGGYIIPVSQARNFASWFFERKKELLSWEIEKSGMHPARFEKKGSALYTSNNVAKYPQITHFTRRFFSRLPEFGGQIFYVGVEKERTADNHNPDGLYEWVLKEAIKRLNQHFEALDGRFCIILDEHPSRDKILTTASVSMFGAAMATRMIEPPFQVESTRFQTIQAADWICGLIGRLGAYWKAPDEWPDMQWAKDDFQKLVTDNSIRSGIRSIPK